MKGSFFEQKRKRLQLSNVVFFYRQRHGYSIFFQDHISAFGTLLKYLHTVCISQGHLSFQILNLKVYIKKVCDDE